MNKDIQREGLVRCVHCGTCKARCPTYLLTHNEAMSARGRIMLLHELREQRIHPTPALAERIFSCMLCEACSGVCPAGVDIPSLLYMGRGVLMPQLKGGGVLRRVVKWVLSRPSQTLPLIRLLQLFMRYTTGRTSLYPMIARRSFKDEVRLLRNPQSKGRIALFSGCSVNYLYPDLGRMLAGLILGEGYEVVVFRGEVCCGEPFRSLGLEREAEAFALRNIEHFSRVHALAVVSLCPTCTMVMKKYYPEIAGRRTYNVMDVNEFITEFASLEGLYLKDRITYHDPCHLNYSLGITVHPRKILQGIKGLELTEMRHPEQCCGFAGLFSIRYRSLSRKITEAKIRDILSTHASTVVTSCPGCVMHLGLSLKKAGYQIPVKHIIQILSESRRSSGQAAYHQE